jgi:hypothetical protein
LRPSAWLLTAPGGVEPGEPAALQQEAPLGDRGGLQDHSGVAIGAYDLASVVDLDGLGALGAGDVDAGEAAAPVEQEAVVDAVLVPVLADDLAVVVDPHGGDALGGGRGQVGRDGDRAVAAPLQQEPRSRAADTGTWVGVRPCHPWSLDPHRGCIPHQGWRRRRGRGRGKGGDHGRAGDGQAQAAAQATPGAWGGCHAGLLSGWVGQAMRPIGGALGGCGLGVAAVFS